MVNQLYYNSCHAILEYDEMQLLTDIGYDVFANGCYNDPRGHVSLPRPAVKGAIYHKDFFELSRNNPKTHLPSELIEPFEALIFMSGESEEVLIANWENIKHKRVIWRTIGQSTPGIERKMARLRDQGLQIIRYSPNEKNIPEYIGEDVLIRFYKDENVYKDWTGEEERVINFTQSLKARRDFCHYDEIFGSLLDFPGNIYGSGNNDLGYMNGGEVAFERQIELYKKSRCFVYAGSYPASYTLAFVEAFMTGIPIVAFSKKVAQQKFEQFNFYEVDSIITDGVDGFIVDTIPQARERIEFLLKNHDQAKVISQNARKKALELFSKAAIREQWAKFLKEGKKV